MPGIRDPAGRLSPSHGEWAKTPAPGREHLSVMASSALDPLFRNVPRPLLRRRGGDSLSAYLDQLSRIPAAGPEKLQEQGERLATTRRRLQEATAALGEEEVTRLAADYEAARQELVRSHLRLVLFLARPYASRSVALIDLVQEGNLGL